VVVVVVPSRENTWYVVQVVLEFSDTGIVGSNPAYGLNVCWRSSELFGNV
jgi:hypothetical protein